MEPIEQLLERAWHLRQARFAPLLGSDNPSRTRSVSLTGTACALNCAHCGRHYLEAMLPIDALTPDDPRLEESTSLLVSGGCDPSGRVPVRAHLEQVRALRPGRRLNWHTGLVGEEDLQAIVELADVVSFDLVGDDETIAEVYGLQATVEDYRATYRLLRRHVPVIPHITIGLRGGRLSGEREALRILQEEGAASIVFLVLIPTPGTRYAEVEPPPVEEVARLLAEARLAFPDTPLLLGCMRPGGPYRRALDPLAIRAGINRIVKPQRTTIEYAKSLGLQIEYGEECCVLPNPSPLLLHRQDQAAEKGEAAAGVRVSAGTEVVLGLRQRPMDDAPTTAYLMLDGGGCAMDCGFCAQARHSDARADALSRIIWPDHPQEQVIRALEGAPPELARVCFQMTAHHGAQSEVIAVVHELHRRVQLPISVAIRPRNVEAIGELLDAGVEAIGLGLDCATEAVYRAVKGPGWAQMIGLVEQACRSYPGHIRVHLMAGLGETEEELIRRIQQVYDWGGTVGLFAFTPVRGTAMEKRPQPPLDSYRRAQAARYLVHHRLARADEFAFIGGLLSGFGARTSELLDRLASGEAFRTSGCPGCNRPYYNERPGGVMYNLAHPLTAAEAAQALAEMQIQEGE